jgi:hypothetical protein
MEVCGPAVLLGDPYFDGAGSRAAGEGPPKISDIDMPGRVVGSAGNSRPELNIEDCPLGAADARGGIP